MIKTVGILTITLMVISPLGAMSEAKTRPNTRTITLRLRDAASRGNLDRVKQLLARDPDLLLADGQGTTALHAAAMAGHTAVVDCLLTYAQEKNIQGTLIMEETQIILPPQEDDDESLIATVVKFAREAGVDEDSLFLGKTVMTAVDKGWNPSRPAPRPQKRAYIDFRNRHESTALHLAAIHGHRDVVKLLLDRGAKQNVRAVENKRYGGAVVNGTPLHGACLNGHEDIAELLVARSAELNAEDIKRRTPYHNAAMGGSLRLVKLLKDKGARIHNVDEDSKDAIGLAIEHKQYRMAGYLLTDSKSINIRTSEGFTVMHLAAMANDIVWAAELEKAGALPHLTDNQGLMPVHHAVDLGCSDMVGWLLVREPDLDESITDDPLLCRAARTAKAEVIEVLIMHRLGRERNFDHSAIGLANRYPRHALSYLEWALTQREIAFYDLMVKKGAVESKEAEFLKDLWKEFATNRYNRLFDKTLNGATALHCAVKLCRLPICLTVGEIFVADALIDQCLRSPQDNALVNTFQAFFGRTLDEAEKVRGAMKPIMRQALRGEEAKWMALLDKPLTDDSWHETKKHIEKLVAQKDELAWPIVLYSCIQGLQEKKGDRALRIRDALYELTFTSARDLTTEAEALKMPVDRVTQLLVEHEIGDKVIAFVMKGDKNGKAAWELANEARHDAEGEELPDYENNTEIAERLRFSNVRQQDYPKVRSLIREWIVSRIL